MRFLVLMVFLSVSTNVFSKETCDTYNNLSPIQKGRLEFAYHQGYSVDLGYTLAAIALTESSAGKYRVNPYSSDFGLFQVNITTLVNTMRVTNHYKRLELVQNVIYNDILGAYVALEVLTYFQKYHKGDWKKTIQSYNVGFNINTTKSLNYLSKVSKEVTMLKRCLVLD